MSQTAPMPDIAVPTDQRLLAGLNAEQQEAVTTTEGPVLVVAGPGSGKTRVLTHRIAYLLEERNVPGERVLAVTFTNKAAREMRDRIERLLGGRGAEGLVMGTFHSFGVRLLRQNPGVVADRLGILPNFLIYDDSDQIDTAKRSVIAVGLDPKQLAPRRVLSRISAAKSLLVGPEEFAQEVETYDDEVVARVYKEYQRTLRRANAVDFDDLLALPIRLFDEAPGLLERYQERFQYVLVDEYQDTNRVQYVLVSALSAKHRNLFVVGDPDQSIYAWRQADIRNILDFEKDYPDARRIHLELNYRSTRRIVETADRVIRENTQRIDRRLRTENEDGAQIGVRELSDQNHEAQFVVGEIRRLLNTGGIRSGDDVAVMYRTTAQSRVLEEAFRVSDIPYRIVGGVRFYDRKEVKDVLAVLRLLHNPADEVSLQRIIDNQPLGRGLGPKAVDAVRAWSALHGEPLLGGFLALAPARLRGLGGADDGIADDGAAPDVVGRGGAASAPELGGAARAAAQKLGTVFAELRALNGQVPLVELFDAVVERTGYAASFNHDNEEEMQRWANVLELRADLEKYDLLAPAEALPTYLEQVALVSDADTMEEDGRGRVTLITLHSAKGLEFPVVFIAGVEEGLLPISRAVEAEFADPMPLEEERRLFYVGITRAERLLYVTYTGNRVTYGRYQPAVASRFLANIPDGHVQSLGRRQTAAGASRLQDRVKRPFPGDTPFPGAPTASAAPPKPAVVYAPGQRVFHPKFGEGQVAEATERAGDQELAIDFARHGRKRLLASLAPMDLL
ncbi:MAG: ATP-dependent DNA helicase UvrD/PcrA [uncultured Thermomicrobiales bacterium]|uniref:DNA 3'-5' helicase n=1 Tax=uncultured Thermomicrobiales bacterium TaxID=1645740 RepID=A0A6J4VJP6_9BACT|nr:MAG: ATP-dependent DNA helicase UvrD/PcrA [uncultured Thermomicrobiales bacterium]